MKIIKSYFHVYDCHHFGQTLGLASTQLSDDKLCFSLGSKLTFNSEPGQGERWSRDRSLEPSGIIRNTHTANPSYQWRLFRESLFIIYAHPPTPPGHPPPPCPGYDPCIKLPSPTEWPLTLEITPVINCDKGKCSHLKLQLAQMGLSYIISRSMQRK